MAAFERGQQGIGNLAAGCRTVLIGHGVSVDRQASFGGVRAKSTDSAVRGRLRLCQDGPATSGRLPRRGLSQDRCEESDDGGEDVRSDLRHRAPVGLRRRLPGGPGFRHRRPPRTSNCPSAGSWSRPTSSAPTVTRCPAPVTTTPPGIRCAGCRPPFCRPWRTTASTPTSTTARTCSPRSPRTSTSRTGGTAPRSPRPAGQQTYLLDFPGINYRADIWLNGHRIADNRQIVGMYTDHRLDVTPWIQPGKPNILAVKVTPERAIQDVDGVELADSWYDWINWRYLGYQGPKKNPANGNSFVPDRNAGIWKPVYLKTSGAVAIGAATVNTELPLPDTDSARADRLRDPAQLLPRSGVSGVLRATITRDGKTPIHVDEAGDAQGRRGTRDQFHPRRFAALTVGHPDLWWPYTMGRPRPLRPQAGLRPEPHRHRHRHIEVRHPHHHPGPRHRRRLRQPGHRRQLLSEGQRQGLPGARGHLHPRPALQVRPGPRRRDPALCQGSRPEHAAAGVQDLLRPASSRWPTRWASR